MSEIITGPIIYGRKKKVSKDLIQYLTKYLIEKVEHQLDS